MKPCHLSLPVVLLFFFSCHNRTPAKVARDTTRTATADTAMTATGDTASVEPDSLIIGGVAYALTYIEDARLELPDRVVTMTSRVIVVNGKPDVDARYNAPDTYFMYLDKKTGKTDTIEAELSGVDACRHCYPIHDMTDSLRIRPFVVQIVTPAGDDFYDNTFLGYQDGKFKVLFTIGTDSRAEGVLLHREGSKLVGYTSGRDEVVEDVQQDYPLEVDTKTFEVTNPIPEKQYIGYPTEATESFRAHRVIAGQVDSSLVAVKAGTELTVDTLYRTLGKVRLRLADSVIVEIKAETARKKLKHNSAG